LPSNFTCTCKPGYTGRHCEIAIDYCISAPCQNNGTCVNSPYGYFCTCASGFVGHNCQTDLDECKIDMCPAKSSCFNYQGGYTCIWATDKTRKRRELPSADKGDSIIFINQDFSAQI
jgi:Notch-like protein